MQHIINLLKEGAITVENKGTRQWIVLKGKEMVQHASVRDVGNLMQPRIAGSCKKMQTEDLPGGERRFIEKQEEE